MTHAAEQPETGKDTKRWARRKEARHRELVSAALGHFIRDGYHAARLDDIAKSANVSKGTVYLYFTDKEDLFKAVVRDSLLPVLVEGEDLISRHEGPTTILLQKLFGGWWELMGKGPASGLAKLVMAESTRFPAIARFYYDEVIARADTMFRRAVQRGIDCGEFRDVPMAPTAAALTAPMMFLMMWRHSFGTCVKRDFTPSEYIDSYINLALYGLAQRDNMANVILASGACERAATELAKRNAPSDPESS